MTVVRFKVQKNWDPWEEQAQSSKCLEILAEELLITCVAYFIGEDLSEQTYIIIIKGVNF